MLYQLIELFKIVVGFHDGKFKGRQYFQCEPNHGVFVLPSEIICVISRRAQRSQKGGREKLLTSREILNRTYGKLGKVGEVNLEQDY